MTMKKFAELELGFADAENYRRRENRTLLNQVFVKNEYLDRLCNPATCFLIGEKGTGKTAYAIYLSNNNYKGNLGALKYIRETEYKKFISLKEEKHLGLSDYTNIWKVIIYLLLSQRIYEQEDVNLLLRKFGRYRALHEAIDEYYNKAFSPEIIQALQFVQESKLAAELLAKYAKAAGEEKETISFSESRFQTNLFYIQKKFESALSQIRLVNNHVLLIDGIDIRPSSIPYNEYLDCIKGLANAVWEVNNDFFPSVKGGQGRMRVTLLIRPDIFESIGMQNQNTKIRDNAVFLDWRTEYINHRSSDLFKVMDNLLSAQQGQALKEGEAWNHYFNWNSPNVHGHYEIPTSFLSFLRWSYYRPRDIITMMAILRDILKEKNPNADTVSYEIFDVPRFKRLYSNYLLGEIKDHLSFYYSSADYELFLKFFEFLDGRNKFDYDFYLGAYKKLKKFSHKSPRTLPQFMSSESDFLQFLYDLNIICYIEKPDNDKPYIRWCFRQRSYANIAPKVKENVEYQIFYGLSKALNVGSKFTYSDVGRMEIGST
jgi:hypothetical protein